MVLDASKFIPAEAIEKLPAFDDKCIDLVVTAPPGFTEKGKEKLCGTSYSWDTLDDYIDYMDKVFTEVNRMLKNQRYCVLLTGNHETLCRGDKGSPKKYPLAAYFTLLLESVGFTYVGEHISKRLLTIRLQLCRSSLATISLYLKSRNRIRNRCLAPAAAA